MGALDVLDIVQYRHADDRDLAALAVDLGAVAHGLIELEPGVGQRRTMQHQAIDVDQPSAAGAFDLGDRVGELGMIGFAD